LSCVRRFITGFCHLANRQDSTIGVAGRSRNDGGPRRGRGTRVGYNSENKETIGPSNGREDRLPSETYAACLRHGRTRLEHAGPKTPPTNEGQKENVLFSILERINSIEDRGFLSSLFSPFLGTTHGQESSKCLLLPWGERGVLFRSSLLFVLHSVPSLFWGFSSPESYD
jgi:hypothetical protein